MRCVTRRNTRLKKDVGLAGGRLGQKAEPAAQTPVAKEVADGLTKKEPAVDQYRDLRKKYYGSSAYDFSENGLITLALRQRQAKPDEALQWLQLNVEFNPKSARSYLMMAQIQNQKGDKDAAIKSVEKAIEAEPDNAQAKQLLQQLKGGH